VLGGFEEQRGRPAKKKDNEIGGNLKESRRKKRNLVWERRGRAGAGHGGGKKGSRREKGEEQSFN